MRYTLEEGAVKFSEPGSGIKIIEHDDVVVWSFDLGTKRAVLDGIMWENGRIGVLIGVGPETLHWDETAGCAWSTVWFEDVYKDEDDSEFWTVIADISRYTLNVCLFRGIYG